MTIFSDHCIFLDFMMVSDDSHPVFMTISDYTSTTYLNLGLPNLNLELISFDPERIFTRSTFASRVMSYNFARPRINRRPTVFVTIFYFLGVDRQSKLVASNDPER